jgi:hypothetical protein
MAQQPQSPTSKSLTSQTAYRGLQLIGQAPPTELALEASPDELEFLDLTLSSGPSGQRVSATRAIKLSSYSLEETP